MAVPHATAPAGLSELADAMVVRTIPEIGTWPIYFVPGVRTPAESGPDGWMRADLMRGEECETLGALSQLSRLNGLDGTGRGASVRLARLAYQARRGRSTWAGSPGARPAWPASSFRPSRVIR